MALVGFFYISLPVIIGSVAFAFLVSVYFRFVLTPLPHKISFTLAVPQGLLAWFAAIATFFDPISAPACLLGAFGFYVSVIVAVLDLLSLILFMLFGAKGADNPSLRQQLAFWILRLITHAGFTLGFLWSAMLCTV